MKSKRVGGWVQAMAALTLAILVVAACQPATPTTDNAALYTPTSVPVASATRGELPSATPVAAADRETPEMPVADLQPTDANTQRVVDLAVADLSQQLSVPEESVLIESVEAVQWPDASLGCPQPGMLYAQVVAPGYLVVLAVADQSYEYHTDRDQLAVLCTDLPLSGPDALGESGLPIFVEMVQAPLSPEFFAQMPPSDAPPRGIYLYNSSDRSLLVAPAIEVLPTTEVLVGLSSATAPERPYVAIDLFQIPSTQPAPLRVIAVDADSGTLTLAYADQTFELGPGESRTFKQSGEGELALLSLTTITNHGPLASVGPLPTDPGNP